MINTSRFWSLNPDSLFMVGLVLHELGNNEPYIEIRSQTQPHLPRPTS